MLKYLIVFCLISFCNSTPGITGQYDYLKLVQHSPISTFFLPQNRDVDTSDDNFLEYISKPWRAFDEDTWVIHGLHAIHNNNILKNCVTRSREQPKYTGISSELTKVLKEKWPNVNINEDDSQLWKNEYDEYGSCIKATETDYFNVAAGILNSYNIGSILAHLRNERDYPLILIARTIYDILGRRFYLRCLQPQNSEKQYLSEVTICIDNSYSKQLIHCFPEDRTHGVHNCDKEKRVIIPKV